MPERNSSWRFVCALLLGLLVPPGPAQAVSPTIVISQVYGGGGNTGATLKNDFIELFNRGNTTVSLDGWSVQYTSSTGSAWQLTPLTGSLDPGQYYLIQEAAGAGGTVDLPTPNATGSIAMSATTGKVALVNTTFQLSGACPSGPSIIDFIGYGPANCFEGAAPAPTLTNTTANLRVGAGSADTDNNDNDFSTGTPDPRNSATPPPPPPVPASIHEIQGSGSVSSLVSKTVTTEGVITARKSNGFFMQIPDDQVDGDPHTSEGIFVFTSSVPPPVAAVGNLVQVTGTVAEFRGDPNSPPLTELGGGPTVTLLSAGYALPSAITITADDTQPTGSSEQLEPLEGMRVHVDSLTTVSPTLGSVNEANASGSSSGVFYAVISGMARPFREPGIDALDPLPPGSPCCVPRFDSNPERLRIDSDAQPGARLLELTSGVTVMNVTGVLDYGFRTYTILPDPTPIPSLTPNRRSVAVPIPDVGELTVASFNMERFFDDVDDPMVGDTVLTTTALNNRLSKVSLAIRSMMHSPDVIGVQEVENESTLQAIATQINIDAIAAGDPNPGYQAYLFEGNDIGGIDSGLLVKSSRIKTISATQEGKDATFTNPTTGQQDLLNDRPPVVLKAKIQTMPFTVVVNHLRSFLDIDDASAGPRVRAKRHAQAEFLASLMQRIQVENPDEKVISVGDYNAFQFNDGYVDTLGTIKGAPAVANNVVLPGDDLVSPDLVNLTEAAATEPYSYVFDGNAQVIDHILITQNLYPLLVRLAFARSNADFPETYRTDPARPERLSDHDMPVAYFTIPIPSPVYLLSVTRSGAGRITGAGIDCGSDCSETYPGFPNIQTVTLEAAPDAGSTFLGWSGDCSGTGTCTISMNADHNVTAQFAGVVTEGTMTGVGAIAGPPGVVFVMFLHCDASDHRGNSLAIAWSGHVFTLVDVTSANCHGDPFTMIMTGKGRFNGVDATIEVGVVDAGELGRDDFLSFVIRQGSRVVAAGAGKLLIGNVEGRRR